MKRSKSKHPTAGVLLSKLRQVCSGFIYDGKRKPHPTANAHAKGEALEEIIDEAGDTPVLVFTQFKAEAALHREAVQVRSHGFAGFTRWVVN